MSPRRIITRSVSRSEESAADDEKKSGHYRHENLGSSAPDLKFVKIARGVKVMTDVGQPEDGRGLYPHMIVMPKPGPVEVHYGRGRECPILPIFAYLFPELQLGAVQQRRMHMREGADMLRALFFRDRTWRRKEWFDTQSSPDESDEEDELEIRSYGVNMFVCAKWELFAHVWFYNDGRRTSDDGVPFGACRSCAGAMLRVWKINEALRQHHRSYEVLNQRWKDATNLCHAGDHRTRLHFHCGQERRRHGMVTARMERHLIDMFEGPILTARRTSGDYEAFRGGDDRYNWRTPYEGEQEDDE